MKTLSAGGRGITLMMLDENETLVQALAIGAAGVLLLGTGRGGKPQEERLAGPALDLLVGKRARRGRAPDTRVKMTVDTLRPALG
jgi:topoisomerase-4 subunit A